MKLISALVLSTFTVSATAQYVGTAPSNVQGDFFYSQDTDKFKTLLTSVGGSFAITNAADNIIGAGPKLGYVDYHGPSTRYGELIANGPILQGTAVFISRAINFQGSIGVKSLSHKTSLTQQYSSEEARLLANATARAITKAINKNPELSAEDIKDITKDIKTDAPTWVPELAKTNIDELIGRSTGTKNYLVLEAELRVQTTEKLVLGGIAVANNVESPRSIQTGTHYLTVAPTLDFEIFETLNFSLITGATGFSDNNTRAFIKSRLTWTFAPDYGLSTYIKVAAQKDNNPGSTNYYSPSTLNSASIGAKFRKRYNGVLITAGGDYGIEQAANVSQLDDKYSAKVKSNIYFWELGVQTYPEKRRGTTFGVSVIGSNNNQTQAIDATNYRWVGLTSWVKIPF